MKLFISADIERCARMTLTYEIHKNETAYGEFVKQMIKEVVVVCEIVHEAGADKIAVKDDHGDATDIDPLCMPDYVILIRDKSGHPYSMISGLDDSFDGAMCTGYHALARNPGFAINHTSTGNSLYTCLNGSCTSEFMLNSYTAASHKVPVLFLSGDSITYSLAREVVLDITTVVIKTGLGTSTYYKAPGQVGELTRQGVKKALTGNFSWCSVEFPETFTYEMTCKDQKKAYQVSPYPRMRAMDTFTNRLETAR